ncbi:hypothetical protein GU927_012920 [Rhodobacteraceae bacterium HSP-20]|uniref:Uncharacterized protein n=1 Tax=Paragemmobacter amnigenus TaxID=2852097 RepID=A0ABS6J5H4_9RHOB|nr:hypothetical protein [Rhodobacter amnigenus]MBU9698747.1 hypothetical protein [Rhodobacter amnigenus]MBV4389974.1 hypothetical protein [Rhodobacter amnigenus]
MPTSEVTAAGKGGDPYAEALDAFLAAHVASGGVVAAYRAVQAMPYFSGPDRTPLAALRTGRGACTAKHLVLRDALRRMGQAAVVEIVEGDFASGIPLHPSMPAELQEMVRAGGVVDFHCRVRLEGGPVLDATWPLALRRWGFDVREWHGAGDSGQAIAQVTVRSTDEDVLGTKARLLAGLSEADSARRLRFLALLSGWLAGLPQAD